MAGFVFMYATLPFMGMDLLIDAVGFLLMFNGLNALRKLEPACGFALPGFIALAMVVPAAVQLFASGGVLAVAGWVRLAGETLLYVLVFRALALCAKAGAAGLPVRLCIGAGMGFALLRAAAQVVGALAPVQFGAALYTLQAAGLLGVLAAFLGVFLLLFTRTET